MLVLSYKPRRCYIIWKNKTWRVNLAIPFMSSFTMNDTKFRRKLVDYQSYSNFKKETEGRLRLDKILANIKLISAKKGKSRLIAESAMKTNCFSDMAVWSSACHKKAAQAGITCLPVKQSKRRVNLLDSSGTSKTLWRCWNLLEM